MHMVSFESSQNIQFLAYTLRTLIRHVVFYVSFVNNARLKRTYWLASLMDPEIE